MFWRVHHTDCPEFSADNAFSAPWGDPEQYCDACGGSGKRYRVLSTDRCPEHGDMSPVDAIRLGQGCECHGFGWIVKAEEIGICKRCKGTGRNKRWKRESGYSCCESPEALVSYFNARGGAAANARVVVFAGDVAGIGPDNEPLVIPRSQPRPRWIDYKCVEAIVDRRSAR